MQTPLYYGQFTWSETDRNSCKSYLYNAVKKRLHSSLGVQQARSHPSFSSIKRLGVFLLLLVHRRVSPSSKFILIGGERDCESKASCPRKQCSGPGRTRTQTPLTMLSPCNTYTSIKRPLFPVLFGVCKKRFIDKKYLSHL